MLCRRFMSSGKARMPVLPPLSKLPPCWPQQRCFWIVGPADIVLLAEARILSYSERGRNTLDFSKRMHNAYDRNEKKEKEKLRRLKTVFSPLASRSLLSGRRKGARRDDMRTAVGAIRLQSSGRFDRELSLYEVRPILASKRLLIISHHNNIGAFPKPKQAVPKPKIPNYGFIFFFTSVC